MLAWTSSRQQLPGPQKAAERGASSEVIDGSIHLGHDVVSSTAPRHAKMPRTARGADGSKCWHTFFVTAGLRTRNFHSSLSSRVFSHRAWHVSSFSFGPKISEYCQCRKEWALCKVGPCLPCVSDIACYGFKESSTVNGGRERWTGRNQAGSHRLRQNFGKLWHPSNKSQMNHPIICH